MLTVSFAYVRPVKEQTFRSWLAELKARQDETRQPLAELIDLMPL